MIKSLKRFGIIFCGTIAIFAFTSVQAEKLSNVEKQNVNYKVKKGAKFTIQKGTQHQVCNNFIEYLSTMTVNETDSLRSVITAPRLKLSLPKANSETPQRFVQLALQRIGTSEIYLSGYNSWLKSIDTIQQALLPKAQLKVEELYVDVNNDGVKEKVLTYSALLPGLGWFYENYVLNQDGNLNTERFKREVNFAGRIFYFNGRTFSYRKRNYGYSIAEHFPALDNYGTTNSKVIGTIIRHGICQIKQN